jgi:cysteine desulfurase
VTTAIEHSSVLGPAAALEKRGLQVRRVGVDARGEVLLEELLAAAREPGTAMLSVLAANNEVGSLGPLRELAAALGELPEKSRPMLHTDAVQALGKVGLDLEGVDLASFSTHKAGGPQGVGVLVRRRGTPLQPLLHGGGQEHELRPGTENVAAIAAAALAIELAVREQVDFAARSASLLRLLWREVQVALPRLSLLGPPLDAPRLPNTINVCVHGVDGRVLVTRLDLDGLEASAGSACASGSLEPSHVLLAMGCTRDDARAGLRLSLGRETTEDDVRAGVEILRKNFSDDVSPEVSRLPAELA